MRSQLPLFLPPLLPLQISPTLKAEKGSKGAIKTRTKIANLSVGIVTDQAILKMSATSCTLNYGLSGGRSRREREKNIQILH